MHLYLWHAFWEAKTLSLSSAKEAQGGHLIKKAVPLAAAKYKLPPQKKIPESELTPAEKPSTSVFFVNLGLLINVLVVIVEIVALLLRFKGL